MSSNRILVGQAFSSADLSEFMEVVAWAFDRTAADEQEFSAMTSFGWYRQAEERSWLSAVVRVTAARIFPRSWVILTWRLPLLLQAFRCLLLDHDLRDDGYGTPESGCIDINCHRCGRSYGRTVLY